MFFTLFNALSSKKTKTVEMHLFAPPVLSEHDQRRNALSSLVREVARRAEHNRGLEDRNVHFDRSERVCSRIKDAALGIKEQRARAVFTHCLGEVPFASEAMTVKYWRRVFSTTVLPKMVVVATVVSSTRSDKHRCLLDAMPVAHNKSTQRQLLSKTLHVDLPLRVAALDERERRRKVLLASLKSALVVRANMHKAMQHAEYFEKVLSELVSVHHSKTNPKTVSSMLSSPSMDMWTVIGLLNMMVLLFLFQLVSMGVGYGWAFIQTRVGHAYNTYHSRRETALKIQIRTEKRQQRCTYKKMLKKNGVMRKKKIVPFTHKY